MSSDYFRRLNSEHPDRAGLTQLESAEQLLSQEMIGAGLAIIRQQNRIWH